MKVLVFLQLQRKQHRVVCPYYYFFAISSFLRQSIIVLLTSTNVKIVEVTYDMPIVDYQIFMDNINTNPGTFLLFLFLFFCAVSFTPNFFFSFFYYISLLSYHY
jgi:hypothetical protein